MLDKRMILRIDGPLVDSLKARARAEGISMSALIRRIFKQAVKRWEK
jgi:predicted HicB family RNase H-like nuclease